MHQKRLFKSVPKPRRDFKLLSTSSRCRQTKNRQQGVVLLVVLMLLLLTTIIGFQVMETSSLESRMAVARQGQEVSFQGAESMVDQAKNDQNLLVSAFISSQSAGSTISWPTEPYSFTGDSTLGGEVTARFIAEVNTVGNDLVIGNTGLRSLHFDLRAEATRVDPTAGRIDDRFDAVHIQGMKRFAPKLQ